MVTKTDRKQARATPTAGGWKKLRPSRTHRPLRFILLGGVCLLTFPAAAQTTKDIIGYSYRCEANFPALGGRFWGSLYIAEEGTRESFFATALGVDASGKEPPDLRAQTLRRLRRESYAEWSGVWGGKPNAEMSFQRGRIGLRIYTARTLPKENILLLGRNNHISSGLVASAERWPGLKSGAEFEFPISELLGFAGKSDWLYWQMYKSALPRNWNDMRKQRASGSLAIAPVQAMERSFEQLVSALETKAASYKSACTRQPVHYNPDAEI